MKFIKKELNKMGVKMNNDKREILAFGKTDTCKTTFQSRTDRAIR